MNVGVFGTGMVGQAIAGKLAALGHAVMMGARSADNPKGRAFVEGAGGSASQGTFADAAAHGEILFNCTAGVHSLEALEAAGADNLRGKILVDVANPLDFSQGMPPRLTVCNDDSLGEQIQRRFPEARVVKALNTVNAQVMVEPSRIPGVHEALICGDDGDAKQRVREILTEWLGWREVIDLGDITNARGTESYLMLWVRLWQALGTADFNLHISKAD